MTYYDLLDKLGYGTEIKRYIDPLLGVGNFGVCGNAVSAYAAKRLTLPGTIPSNARNRFADVSVVSFPGGNAAILRKMWARMLPGAISGDGSLAAAAQGDIDFEALDRAGAPLRIRLESTAVHIRHEGNPASASRVRVTYVRGGKLHCIRAKAVVMGSGGWVNRNVVGDLPRGACRGLRPISLWTRADCQRSGAPLALFRQARIHGGALVHGAGMACVRAPQCGLATRCRPVDAGQPHRPHFLHPAAAPGSRPERSRHGGARAIAVDLLCRLSSARSASSSPRCSAPRDLMRGAISPASS